VSGGVAIATLGVGLALVLAGGDADSDDARAERLHAPRIGFSITPDGVGVSASGRF
jgi:hypothetical protein